VNSATNAVEIAFIRDNYRELSLGRNGDGSRALFYKITETNGMSTVGAATWRAPLWDYFRIEQWIWNPRSKAFYLNGFGDALSRDMIDFGVVSLADRDIYLLVPGFTGEQEIGLQVEILYDDAGRISSVNYSCDEYHLFDEIFVLKDQYSELPYWSGLPDGSNIDLEPHQLCVGGKIVANNNYSCIKPKKNPAIRPSRGLSLSAMLEIQPALEALRQLAEGETNDKRAKQNFKSMQSLLKRIKPLIHAGDLVRFNAVQFYVNKGTARSVKLTTLKRLAVQLRPFIESLTGQ